MVCITVERLSFSALLFYLTPYFIAQRRSQPQSQFQVWIINAHPVVLAVAPFIFNIFHVDWKILKFRLRDVYDQRGNFARLTIRYNDLFNIQKEIINSSFFKDACDSANPEEGLKDFFKKSVVSFNDNSRLMLWQILLVVELSRQQAAVLKLSNIKNVLFIHRTFGSSVIKLFFKKQGIDLRDMNHIHLDPKQWLKDKINPFWVRYIKSLMQQAKIIKDLPSDKPISNPRLAMEYYGLLNLEDKCLYSNFMFWQESSFKGSDILITTSLTAAPLTISEAEQLRKYEITPIALHPEAILDRNIPVFCPPLKPSPSMVKKLPTEYAFEYHWFKKLAGIFSQYREYYTQLFKTFNVQIYLTWFKYDASHIIIADAIRRNGGIIALYQRAMEPEGGPETATFCDVYFGFSQHMARTEEKSGSRIGYYVITGYIGDHRFELLKVPAAQLRQQLMTKGAKRIIAFFDENSGSDARWNIGHAFMRENYQFILERVLEDSQLGLVLKPKTPKTLRQRLGPVAVLLEQAMATGRCHLYEDQGLQSSFPPAIAALSSDLTIHAHMCSATAGLEAALANVPTVLLDREGWPDCSMYRLGEGKVIFRSWEEFWRAWEGHKRIANSQLGNWSSHIHEFDPFRDGKAAHRMGEYLGWLMEGFKQGLPREQILKNAAQRYMDQWGKDKVITIGRH